MPEFKIDPDTIYTMDALRDHLTGIMHIATFIRHLRHYHHEFKNAWLGSEILAALDHSSIMNRNGTENHDESAYSRRCTRRHGKAPEIPLDKILKR